MVIKYRTVLDIWYLFYPNTIKDVINTNSDTKVW